MFTCVISITLVINSFWNKYYFDLDILFFPNWINYNFGQMALLDTLLIKYDMLIKQLFIFL